MQAVQSYKFGDVVMEVRLHGFGRVEVELIGHTQGKFIDGVIAWKGGNVDDPQEMRMLSGAIRGKKEVASELCEYLLAQILAHEDLL